MSCCDDPWSVSVGLKHTPATKQPYTRTQAGFRKENILPNVAEWWANGNMIDNEKARFSSILVL